jgi:hypothetical protein
MMQVLLDALAFLRALALLISVYKSFDVFGDLFITYNATSASHIRSVIAKYFHELLLDCLWLLRPLWSFEWYVFYFHPFFPFSFDPNRFPGTATSQLLQPTSCSSQLKCWPRSCHPLVLFALQVQSRPMIHCRSLGQGRLTMLSVSCKRDWGFSFVGSRAMQRSSCGRVSLRFLLFSFFASFPAIKTI